MENIVFVGKITEEFIDIEDGGAAMIAEPSYEMEGADECFFVRLQSYDESVWENNNNEEYTPKDEIAKTGHKTMHSLIGKKVRITIEVIEE